MRAKTCPKSLTDKSSNISKSKRVNRSQHVQGVKSSPLEPSRKRRKTMKCNTHPARSTRSQMKSTSVHRGPKKVTSVKHMSRTWTGQMVNTSAHTSEEVHHRRGTSKEVNRSTRGRNKIRRGPKRSTAKMSVLVQCNVHVANTIRKLRTRFAAVAARRNITRCGSDSQQIRSRS